VSFFSSTSFEFLEDLLPLAGFPLQTLELSLNCSYRVSETLGPEVLTAMHAPEKRSYANIKAADLPKYDAFLFGIPTRYGNFPGQWKAFIDTTGGLWAKGDLHGMFAPAYPT